MIGVMEYWSVGVMGRMMSNEFANTPLLQHSITPVVSSCRQSPVSDSKKPI
jgi:hypothetical protein